MQKRNVFLVIILMFLCLAVGISIGLMMPSEKEVVRNDNNQTNVNNNLENNNLNSNKNKILINNPSVDEKTLEELLGIIGVYPEEETVSNSLNVLVSNNNYKSKMHEIFSYYFHDQNIWEYPDDEKCLMYHGM